MKREELEFAVEIAHKQYTNALSALDLFERSLEDNAYSTLEYGLMYTEIKLMDRVRDAESLSHYMVGISEYTQEFVVDRKHYIGKVQCNYHNNTKDVYKFTYTEA